MLVAHLFSALAFGQAPAGLPPLLPGFPSGMTVRSSADARWLVADTASLRFPGEQVPGPQLTAGAEVEVIVTEGDQVRVRAGDKYGWVPASALTATAPAPAMPASPGLLGMPPLQPPKP